MRYRLLRVVAGVLILAGLLLGLTALTGGLGRTYGVLAVVCLLGGGAALAAGGRPT
jgi:hypothetical protein